MGLSDERKFAQYHQVLNRAVWSSLTVSQVLLGLIVTTLVGEGEPLVAGLDDTIERRWGKKIEALGIYRDPVRSSKRHLVKASGLRWLSLMALVTIPWAQRVWALLLLTASAPSERSYQQRGREPKSLLERAWQMILPLRRWLPAVSCWWETAPMPRWTSCTAANPCPIRSPSLPACGWMRGCMSLPRLIRAKAARVSKVNVCPPCNG